MTARSNNMAADGRDDASTAEARQTNERSDSSSSSSVSPSTTGTHDVSADDRSVSSAPIRPRLTKEQVQIEEAKAASSSMSVTSTRSSRSQRVSSSTSVSSKSNNEAEAIVAPKTPSTYADEYLRAALATPSSKPHRRSADASPSFPSSTAASQSSYTSDVGRIYDDPPEITSIPTDEIVDSYTRPTIGEPTDGREDLAAPEDEAKEPTETTTMRGSRDEYTFGRLQARASKRREMLEQVPEEEDVTNYHSVARASRIKNIRSLYLAVEEVEEMKSPVVSPVKSLLGQSVTSPVSQGGVCSPVNSPTKESYSPFLAHVPTTKNSPLNSMEQRYPIDVSSPTSKSVGDVVETVHSPMNSALPSLKLRPGTVISPTNQSVASVARSPSNHSIGKTVGSPTNHSVGSVVGSPTNQSVANGNAVGSPTNHSVANAVGNPTNQSVSNAPNASPVVSPSNYSVGNLSTIENHGEFTSNHSVNNASVATGHNSKNTNTMQSTYGRKSSQTSSNSETQSTAELSEYRVKLFAKMLHLLDDVEHPGLHTSATRDSHRTYEYSVEELKLIQKRTEEEMSRILNEFDRSKTMGFQAPKGEMTDLRQNIALGGTSVKDCHDDHDYCSTAYEKGPPPPNVMMSEVIASKLSDITSPTTCQDNDNASHYYNAAAENDDEVIEGSSRNLPPRPSSPRKKRTPVFPVVGGEDGLPIVQEASDVAASVAKSGSMDNTSRVPGSHQSIKRENSSDGTTKVESSVDESNPIPTSPKSPKSVNTINATEKVLTPKGLITTVIESIGSANLSVAQGFEATMNGNTPKREQDQTVFFGPDMDEETPADKYKVCLSGSEQVSSPQNEARDKLLAASRNAARRSVKKQRQQEEDRFHDDIMSAVSAAEEGGNHSTTAIQQADENHSTPEIQQLNDEVSSFIATFDVEVDEPRVMNEDGSINEEVATMLLAEGGQEQLAQPSFPLQQQQLQAPTHNQCGGCRVQ